VELELRDASPLAAIDAVCRQAGLQPVYSDRQLLVRPGVESPSAFAGPFRLLVQDVVERHPNATGFLELRLESDHLPPPMAAFLGLAPEPPLVDWRVRATDGSDLYHAALAGLAPPSDRPAQQPALDNSRSYRVDRLRVPLKNLLRDVDVLAEVRVTLRLPVPARLESFQFETLTPGTVRGTGSVRLTVRGRDAPALTFDVAGGAGWQACWMAKSPTGSTFMSGLTPLPTAGPLTLDVRSVEAVAFKVFQVASVGFEFVLRDVPLRQRPPRRLEPPRFPGHAEPVTVQYVSVNADSPSAPPELAGGAGVSASSPRAKQTLVLRVRNNTQKDVTRLVFELTYLDAKDQPLGQEQKSQAYSETYEYMSHLRSRESGSVTLQDVAAPAGTSKVTAKVIGVEFLDTTTWKR
jgi:hypothetical protein